MGNTHGDHCQVHATQKLYGKTQRLEAQNQVGGCRCAQTLGRDTKEQSRAHSPADGDRPGPTCGPRQARKPRTPTLPRRHKADPKLARGGLESRRAGAARRRPQASVSFRHRSPAVPWKLGGGASARPAAPLAPGPVALAAVAHAPHRHRAASPEARPPRLRRPHQKATCQRLSEPRDDAAAAVAPASAAPPLPSWLRPEVTSAGRPPPRHRPEAELVARDPSGPRQGSVA